MEQLKWLLNNENVIRKEVKGYYKVVNYSNLNSLACTLSIWVKSVERRGDDEWDDYDETEELLIRFDVNGSIKEMKRI